MYGVPSDVARPAACLVAIDCDVVGSFAMVGPGVQPDEVAGLLRRDQGACAALCAAAAKPKAQTQRPTLRRRRSFDPDLNPFLQNAGGWAPPRTRCGSS